MNQGRAGKSSTSRQRLSELLQKAGEIISVEQAAKILNISHRDTAKILARWKSQGWLTRISRGLYSIVPLDTTSNEHILEDAWILVPKLFNQAYIGGWSAAEYWDLTEQIFRDLCVFTTKRFNKKNLTVHNIPFFLTQISENNFFGTKVVWKKDNKVLVSDLEKTIIDMFSNPQLGGGILHTISCFKEYLKRDDWNPNKLIEYAIRLKNGAVFKRLGYLSSLLLGDEHALTIACSKHLTKGKAYLDPNLPDGKLITRWHLFVPTNFTISGLPHDY